MPRISVLMFVMFAAIFAGGCTSRHQQAFIDAGASHSGMDDLANKRETDEPIMIDVAGGISVDVESFAGMVIVEADSRLTQARVTVTREATHGYQRSKEAKASLPEIAYSVELNPATAGDLNPILQIKTWTDHPEPHFQRAHLLIEAPTIDGVTIRTHRGKVYARGVEGRIDIITDEGDVRVMTRLPMTKPVTILNRGGDIDYRVRGESTAVFDARCINGSVDIRARNGRLTTLPGRTVDRMLASLNDGTNAVELRTIDGDIRIAVVPDPEAVGHWIVTP